MPDPIILGCSDLLTAGGVRPVADVVGGVPVEVVGAGLRGPLAPDALEVLRACAVRLEPLRTRVLGRQVRARERIGLRVYLEQDVPGPDDPLGVLVDQVVHPLLGLEQGRGFRLHRRPQGRGYFV